MAMQQVVSSGVLPIFGNGSMTIPMKYLQGLGHGPETCCFRTLSDVPARAVFHDNTQRYVRFLRAPGELVGETTKGCILRNPLG